MDLFATLRRSGGIDALARQADVSLTDAAAAARDLLPEVVALFGATFPPGIPADQSRSKLSALLARLGGSELAFAFHEGRPITPERRRQIIAILPGADRTAPLIAGVRKRSVVSADALEATLPLVVMLVGGYLAARLEAAPAQLPPELLELFGTAAGQG